MKEPIKELLLPCLSHWGFTLSRNHSLYKAGYCYDLKEELGNGTYWYYEKKDMFALALMDLCLKEDISVEYAQPDFISLTYYDTVSGEQLTPYKRLNANCIRGHVSDKNVYRARYHKNVPIRGMELMLIPDYFNHYLSSRYPDKRLPVKELFLSMDGISDFTELLLLMRQIQSFQGSGLSAELFYESKVTEIISLLLEKAPAPQNSPYSSDRELSEDDHKNLELVNSYISDHFAFHLPIEQLAKMACMSQSKLRYCFKGAYGCTITEFIQNKRIAQAEYMLLETTLQINQISQAVGYHHAGRFSSLFQKSTGLLPEEYRRTLRK